MQVEQIKIYGWLSHKAALVFSDCQNLIQPTFMSSFLLNSSTWDCKNHNYFKRQK